MAPGQKFLTPVGLGWVSHLWFGLEFGKFPLKMSNFSIFSLRIKNNCFGSGPKAPRSKPGRPLIYCGSKVSSGRVRAHLNKAPSISVISICNDHKLPGRNYFIKVLVEHQHCLSLYCIMIIIIIIILQSQG